ncbi:MAG: MMPL family transporter [Propionibacteriaceae bacterium]|jgi:RND superfamily putative drug exporter|nr:MMPL family transporter [Propionibacteriaceae bacterium]
MVARRSIEPELGRLEKIALWSATHRLLSITGWVLFILATFALSMVFVPERASMEDQLQGDSKQAAVVSRQAGWVTPSMETVLATAPDGGEVDLIAAQAAFTEIADRMSDSPDVATIGTTLPPGSPGNPTDTPVTHLFMPSTDGLAVMMPIEMAGDPTTSWERVDPLRDITAAVAADYPQLVIVQTGDASINAEAQTLLDGDLMRAAVVSIPVALIILLVAFGALLTAVIPVVLAVASVLSGLGLWALAGQVIPDQGMVQHVIVLIGMAVGVDYSLFYLRRYREELHRGDDRLAALTAAARTAGHSVLISGSAVSLSLLGTLAIRDMFFTGMGVGAILVVLVAMVSSVTALPALIVSMSRWIDRPRVPLLWRLTDDTRPARVLPALVSPVIRHPLAALVVAVAALAALSAPALSMRLALSDTDDLPRSLDTLVAYDTVTEHFPSSAATVLVVAQAPAGAEASLQSSVQGLAASLTAHPDLFGGFQGLWTSEDGAAIVATIATASGDEAVGEAAVTELRDTLVPEFFSEIAGAEVHVGGGPAMNMDYAAHLRAHLVPLVAIVIAITSVFIIAVYRSIPLAVITVFLNLLSAAAAFGATVLVFQNTWAEGILGFTSSGSVIAWVPLLLFVVLFGLSLDYHIFVVSRIQENMRQGLEMREAIREGVVRTGGVVTSAAAIMIGVFAIFASLSFLELKQIGVGLTVAILLDATVIRIIALPALMVLCRRFLWWPGERALAVTPQRALRQTSGYLDWDSPSVRSGARRAIED